MASAGDAAEVSSGQRIATSVEVTEVDEHGIPIQPGRCTKKAAVPCPRGGPSPTSESATGREPEQGAAASSSSAAACDAAVAAAGDDEKPMKQHRMSKREIRRILNHEPMAVVPTVLKELKLRNPELVPSPEEEADEATRELYAEARAFYESEERYPELQARVRRELEEKGYVEVDDEWVRRREEMQAIIDEAWERIEQMLIGQTDGEDDDDESSDEEVEEG